MLVGVTNAKARVSDGKPWLTVIYVLCEKIVVFLLVFPPKE